MLEARSLDPLPLLSTHSRTHTRTNTIIVSGLIFEKDGHFLGKNTSKIQVLSHMEHLCEVEDFTYLFAFYHFEISALIMQCINPLHCNALLALGLFDCLEIIFAAVIANS